MDFKKEAKKIAVEANRRQLAARNRVCDFTDFEVFIEKALERAFEEGLSRNPVKVALDVQIPESAQWPIERRGFNIVAWARDGEPDRSWFRRSMDKGAQIIVTADREVQGWARDLGLEFVDIPDGLRGTQLADKIAALVVGARNRLRHSAPGRKRFETLLELSGTL